MTYNIAVKDGATGAPIPAAFITFTSQGVQVAQLATDTTGAIQLDSDNDSPLLQSNVQVTVSAPGYGSYNTTGSALAGNVAVSLSKSSISTPMILGGAVLAAYLLFGKKW